MNEMTGNERFKKRKLNLWHKFAGPVKKEPRQMS